MEVSVDVFERSLPPTPLWCQIGEINIIIVLRQKNQYHASVGLERSTPLLCQGEIRITIVLDQRDKNYCGVGLGDQHYRDIALERLTSLWYQIGKINIIIVPGRNQNGQCWVREISIIIVLRWTRHHFYVGLERAIPLQCWVREIKMTMMLGFRDQYHCGVELD